MFEKNIKWWKIKQVTQQILIYLYGVKLMHIAHIIFMHLFS